MAFVSRNVGILAACLAAGRPTITTDLVHTTDIPRSIQNMGNPCATEAGEKARETPEPVSISIDILDEDHSLRLAMRRLAADNRLRATLGRNARELWEERFRVERMVSAYSHVIEAASAAPLPRTVDSSGVARSPRHRRD